MAQPVETGRTGLHLVGARSGGIGARRGQRSHKIAIGDGQAGHPDPPHFLPDKAADTHGQFE
jgi:hypothetical protein